MKCLTQINVVKSVYDNQHELIDNLMSLHCQDGLDADITYGNGSFYKCVEPPELKFDIDPQCKGVIAACSTSLPLANESLKSVMFDPPFLTYVRANRNGNGKMIMAKRFSGYWRYNELEDHYRKTLVEAHRVLKRNGILIFKCQDIIHNHKMHCTHANVLQWAEGMFVLKDLFVLSAKNRMPSPNRAGQQKHSRIFHSYFLVLAKAK